MNPVCMGHTVLSFSKEELGILVFCFQNVRKMSFWFMFSLLLRLVEM